jgi:hypothetical protein
MVTLVMVMVMVYLLGYKTKNVSHSVVVVHHRSV